MKRIVCESLEEYNQLNKIDENWKKGLVGAAMIGSLIAGMPKQIQAQSSEPVKTEQTTPLSPIKRKLALYDILNKESKENREKKVKMMENSYPSIYKVIKSNADLLQDNEWLLSECSSAWYVLAEQERMANFAGLKTDDDKWTILWMTAMSDNAESMLDASIKKADEYLASGDIMWRSALSSLIESIIKEIK